MMDTLDLILLFIAVGVGAFALGYRVGLAMERDRWKRYFEEHGD